MSILEPDAKIYQLVHSIFHHSLQYYIADANRNTVLNELYHFFDKNEVAIISKQQLKVYQELEKTALGGMLNDK